VPLFAGGALAKQTQPQGYLMRGVSTIRSGNMRLAAAGGIVALVGALCVAVAAPAPPSGRKDEIQTQAPYAILIGAESGAVLFEKNADELVAPSSLAKLMTAEVVFHQLEQGSISLEDEFIISEDAWRRGGAPSHTSSMFAPIYSRVKVENLLRGMIIQSGNDASIALAQGVAGSEPKFAQMMNERAREIGLTRSYFAKSTGLPDPSLKVTVRDLGKLARHIINTYPEYYPIYGEKDFTWNKIHQQNRNPLLTMNIGADGMKTGYTSEGGYGLVGSAVQNGLRLIVVVNGLKGQAERATEGKRLLEWGFKNFEQRPLFAEGQAIGYAKVFGGAQGSVALTGPGAVSILVPRGSNDRLLARITYRGPVSAPITQGQTIGTLKVWRAGRQILDLPLQALEDVPTGNMTQRAIDAAGELMIGLFRAGTKRI
jgi:D-alanyl-D-alanine carboxypeptidase (penicillin-binding protein 5/6)